MTDHYLLSATSPLYQLQLRFEFVGDRFRHALYACPAAANDGLIVEPAAPHALLCSSVEGTATDDWPSSPAFQEVSLEPIGGQLVALATGKAGCSYWSASVAAIEGNPEQASPGFEFDVAVRTQQPAQFLGSTYAFQAQSCLSRSDKSTWSVATRAGDEHLNDSGTHSIKLTVRLLTGYGEAMEPGGLVLGPALTPASPANSLVTLRWKYSILCEPASL